MASVPTTLGLLASLKVLLRQCVITSITLTIMPGRETSLETNVCSSEGIGRVLCTVGKISSILGIVPCDIDHKTFEMKFKLFSLTSLKALIKLLIFNLPFIGLPSMIKYSGLLEQEFKSLGLNINDTVKGDIYSNKVVHGISTFSYWCNYLYYALPFILWNRMATPMTKISQILMAERNIHLMKNPPNAEELLLPLISLVVYYIGTLIFAAGMIQQQESLYPGIASSSSFLILILGYAFTAKLGLQFLLAVQEFYFYHFSTYYRRLSQSILLSDDLDQLLAGTGDLIAIMEHFQECYGLFLLVDLTIMFFHWLYSCYQGGRS